MYLPGYPCHIIQRGNNREATFFTEQDYLFYLACLEDAAKRYRVEIHAYVLMTNHVHLLTTPSYKESISLAMQSVGRRYVQYINKEYFRTGTLWEGRHKASIVDAESYLLTCSRYIEMNPVAANMVKHPAKYRWSSYRANAFGETNELITQHEVHKRIGNCEPADVKAMRSCLIQLLILTMFVVYKVLRVVRCPRVTSDSSSNSRLRSSEKSGMSTGEGREKVRKPNANTSHLSSPLFVFISICVTLVKLTCSFYIGVRDAQADYW